LADSLPFFRRMLGGMALPPILFVAVLMSLAPTARAQLTTITGLFTTGVDNSNVLLGNNVTDSHYVVTAKPAGAPADNLGSSMTVSTALPAGWAANTSGARWVTTPGTPAKGTGTGGANPQRVSGTFDYTLTFTMPVGAQLTTVSITGTGAADDSATIYVNGVLVSGQSLNAASGSNSFTLNSSNAAFAAGTNTITFSVNNVTNKSNSGLLIDSFSGSVIVPETAAYLPPAGAVGIYALLALRRKWRTKRAKS
jgi:hypothetical protein